MLGPVFDHGNELIVRFGWSFGEAVERVLGLKWELVGLFALVELSRSIEVMKIMFDVESGVIVVKMSYIA